MPSKAWCNLLRLIILAGILFPRITLAQDQLIYGPPGGWFFYKDPHAHKPLLPPKPKPPVPGKAEPQKPTQTMNVQIGATSAPAAPATKAPGPAVGSVAWLHANLPKIRDDAIDNPTYANVRLYAYLQRLGLDKADRFSDVYERVMMTDPVLDESDRRPSSQSVKPILDDRVRAARRRLFTQLGKQKAFAFFFKGHDKMCDAMAKEVHFLGSHYGISILPVSMDGQPLDNNLYPHYKVDHGQAKAMNVFLAPAIVLYDPSSDKWIPIIYGFHGTDAIISHTLQVARLHGWISKQQFDSTQKEENNMLLSLPDHKKVNASSRYHAVLQQLLKSAGYE